MGNDKNKDSGYKSKYKIAESVAASKPKRPRPADSDAYLT